MNKAEMFNMLISKELSENLALTKLKKKKLWNWKMKIGLKKSMVMRCFMIITKAELAIEELSECITFSFEIGRKIAL